MAAIAAGRRRCDKLRKSARAELVGELRDRPSRVRGSDFPCRRCGRVRQVWHAAPPSRSKVIRPRAGGGTTGDGLGAMRESRVFVPGEALRRGSCRGRELEGSRTSRCGDVRFVEHRGGDLAVPRARGPSRGRGGRHPCVRCTFRPAGDHAGDVGLRSARRARRGHWSSVVRARPPRDDGSRRRRFPARQPLRDLELMRAGVTVGVRPPRAGRGCGRQSPRPRVVPSVPRMPTTWDPGVSFSLR